MRRITITKFPRLDYMTSEAMNELCVNLSFLGDNVRKIMVTSTDADEGKTFCSINLTRTLADLGKNVVLVDADLRRSVLASRYGMRTTERDTPGITHYLAGMCSIDDVLYETNIANMYVVPVRREVSNSLPLLNTPRFSALIDALGKSFEYVVVDVPPVGMLIDAAEIAKSCDGTLIVVRHNTVSRRQLQGVVQQIQRTGCPILGTVLNDVPLNTYSGKKYYRSRYGYYKRGYYVSGTKKKETDDR